MSCRVGELCLRVQHPSSSNQTTLPPSKSIMQLPFGHYTQLWSSYLRKRIVRLQEVQGIGNKTASVSGHIKHTKTSQHGRREREIEETRLSHRTSG